MADYLDDLLKFWRRHGVDPASHTCTQSEIALWEGQQKVILPRDLRGYVMRVNGIRYGERLEFDHELISFLPLTAMCPEAHWNEGEARGGMFVFADFMIQSYWWCAALDGEPREHTRIFLGGGTSAVKNRLVAHSLKEFFDLYINFPTRIHF